MSLLAAIANQSLHNDTDHEEIQGAALVLESLRAPSSDRTYQALVEAKALGVDLRQVGTLALITDARGCADLLKTRFDIPVEDYRSTGAEGGMDCRAGYPLLATLAYGNHSDLQRRALEWGADPSATWRVNNELGDYREDRARFTISWASQVIRRGDVELADEIMAAAGPASVDEQHRRFSALLPLRDRIQDRNNSLRRFKDMMDLLAPGGAHALEISPWEIPDGDTPLAASLVGLFSGSNPAFDSIRALNYMMPWIKQTARIEQEDHVQALIKSISHTRSTPSLPEWCVDHLTPTQARKFLGLAWPQAVSQWLETIVGVHSNFIMNTRTSLENALKPFSGVTAIALSGDSSAGPLCSHRRLLGCMSFDLFSKLGSDHVQAIEEFVPALPGSADRPAEDLSELTRLLEHRHALWKESTNPTVSGPQKTQIHEELKEVRAALLAMHTAFSMNEITPKTEALARPPLRM